MKKEKIQMKKEVDFMESLKELIVDFEEEDLVNEIVLIGKNGKIRLLKISEDETQERELRYFG